MNINYLDTVTMYYNCPFDLRSSFTCHWINDNKNQDKNLHCFCIKTEYAFIRYYPDLYGVKRLYVTFSLPKLYFHYNRNTFNVTNYDNQTFMDILYSELNKVIDISKILTVLADWQPSRIDLFRMREIDPVDRKEYLYGYDRLTYRGAVSKTYKNTTYLSSSKKAKCSNLILRTYNKTIEEQDKKSLLSGNLPVEIEEEHEELMRKFLLYRSPDPESYHYNNESCYYNNESNNDLYRYEFSLRRISVKRYCKKYNKQLNMETIMSEDFQKTILNDLVISRGLHYDILSKKDFKNAVSNIFPTEKSIDNALKLAESIRNKKPMPLKKHQEYRIRKKLNSHSISTATTNFVSIKGLDLL